MRIGLHGWSRVFANNRMLEDFPTHEWGGDHSNRNIALLARKLRQAGHQVSTIDTQPLDSYDKVLFLEFPEYRTSGRPNRFLRELLRLRKADLYLLCIEPPAIKPNNWTPQNLSYFKKIFTWSDEHVDGQRFIRVHSTSHSRDERPCFEPAAKRGFCVLAARQKHSSHPDELYSERVRAMRWFEANAPGKIDLYGTAWDQHHFSGRWERLNLFDHYVRRVAAILADSSGPGRRLSRSAPLGRLAARVLRGGRPLFPFYRGPVVSVRDTLSRYRFSICIENCKSPGWVTERIFDSLLAGCVPIYLGDPNISNRIPSRCFVDLREYAGYEALYGHLTGMSESEYLGYIDAARTFFESPESSEFSVEHYAETVAQQMLEQGS